MTALWDTSCKVTKRCSSCGIQKPADLEHFQRHVGGKHGVRGQCKTCRISVVKRYNATEIGQVAREKTKAERRLSGAAAASSKGYRERNPEKIREASDGWRRRNADRVRAVAQDWRDRNRQKVRAKQRMADAKLQASPQHVLKKRIKARVRALVRGATSATLEAALGYSSRDLCRHIERQFTEGMTWERLMRGEIHIDHIIPASRFSYDSMDSPDFRACWALSNLRPMWALDNQKKQSQVLSLL